MGGGLGYYFSEWILEGEPSIDMSGGDPRRFGSWATKRFASERNREQFGNNFGVFYPDYQMQMGRTRMAAVARKRPRPPNIPP